MCSICLDVFTNPSSTPCGHSFCMACISKYWDGSKVCRCMSLLIFPSVIFLYLSVFLVCFLPWLSFCPSLLHSFCPLFTSLSFFLSPLHQFVPRLSSFLSLSVFFPSFVSSFLSLVCTISCICVYFIGLYVAVAAQVCASRVLAYIWVTGVSIGLPKI